MAIEVDGHDEGQALPGQSRRGSGERARPRDELTCGGVERHAAGPRDDAHCRDPPRTVDGEADPCRAAADAGREAAEPVQVRHEPAAPRGLSACRQPLHRGCGLLCSGRCRRSCRSARRVRHRRRRHGLDLRRLRRGRKWRRCGLERRGPRRLRRGWRGRRGFERRRRGRRRRGFGRRWFRCRRRRNRQGRWRWVRRARRDGRRGWGHRGRGRGGIGRSRGSLRGIARRFRRRHVLGRLLALDGLEVDLHRRFAPRRSRGGLRMSHEERDHPDVEGEGQRARSEPRQGSGEAASVVGIPSHRGLVGLGLAAPASSRPTSAILRYPASRSRFITAIRSP